MRRFSRTDAEQACSFQLQAGPHSALAQHHLGRGVGYRRRHRRPPLRRHGSAALRQQAIEKKLALRHLGEGALVLYDVTSSYYEGKTCPLARFGYDRDGKTGCPIIVYGMLTDADGRPVAVHVYPGNTGDPKTVPDQVEALTKRFGLSPWFWSVIVARSHKRKLMCSRNTRAWAGSRRCVAARSAACWPMAT